MLWLLLIVIVGGLLFVMFHKPSVNAMGAGWTPPAPLPPQPTQSTQSTGESIQVAQAPAPFVPTFDLNDLYSGVHKMPTPPQDQPRA